MNNPLRDLARSEYWQNMYRASKELNIKLFVNDSNLSRLQIVFLSFLSLYDGIYTDIASGDSGLMDYNRIKDDYLTDAYLTCKRKNRNKDNKDTQKVNPKKINTKGIPSISFVSPKER